MCKSLFGGKQPKAPAALPPKPVEELPEKPAPIFGSDGGAIGKAKNKSKTGSTKGFQVGLQAASGGSSLQVPAQK